MLKSRLLGENPCDVDRLFRRIKQFGGHGRQGGGVSAVEIALWDLAGKAYGVPIYQMLGGKFRDKVRMYCDTDASKPSGTETGKRLKERMALGFTFLKMDLGLGQIMHVPGAVGAPTGLLESYRDTSARICAPRPSTSAAGATPAYDVHNVPHPFTGLHFTEKGLDLLEQYIAEVRELIGPEMPLAIDHFGHISLQDGIRLARRIEKYTPAWLEDVIPWQYTDQYEQLQKSTAVPICTGEDIYLKEDFMPLLRSGGVSVIHPDLLTTGGILETKKIGDAGAGPRRRHGHPHGREPGRRAWPRPTSPSPPRTSWRSNTTRSTSPGGTISPSACPSRSSRTASSRARQARPRHRRSQRRSAGGPSAAGRHRHLAAHRAVGRRVVLGPDLELRVDRRSPGAAR